MREISTFYIQYCNISMLMIPDTQYDLEFGLSFRALETSWEKPCGCSSEKCGVWSWDFTHESQIQISP